jgi:hypothetical protein
LNFANHDLDQGDTAMIFHTSLIHTHFWRRAEVRLLVLLILSISIFWRELGLAQPEEPIRCGVQDLTPEQVQQLQGQLNRWLAEGGRVLSAATTIPVAFHVVRYDDGGADVTDQQINDQIDVLNGAFGNTNFQFTLHSIDRVDSSEWSDHRMGSAEESQMKQSLGVDPAHVLNFYTCGAPRDQFGNLLLGYATFPWMYPENSLMHGLWYCTVAFQEDRNRTTMKVTQVHMKLGIS